MATTRRFCADDLFRFAPTNLDALTETYHLGFYALYLSRGPDLATLYVTSARVGLAADAEVTQPQAGNVFALDVGVRGLPEARFGA